MLQFCAENQINVNLYNLNSHVVEIDDYLNDDQKMRSDEEKDTESYNSSVSGIALQQPYINIQNVQQPAIANIQPQINMQNIAQGQNQNSQNINILGINNASKGIKKSNKKGKTLDLRTLKNNHNNKDHRPSSGGAGGISM